MQRILKYALLGLGLMLVVPRSAAQIQLLFKTSEDYTFFVGINGFAQNTDPVKSICINNLDTGFIKINLLALGADTLMFERSVRLLEKDKQMYLLTRNYLKQPKLQYRGIIENIPLDVPKIKAQRVLPWSQILENKLQKPPAPDTLVIAVAEQPDTTNSVETTVLGVSITELKAVKDSLNNVSVTLNEDTAKPNKPKGNLAALESRMNTAQNEFEKLQILNRAVEAQKLSVPELIQLSQNLRYDDSRLQVALLAINSMPNADLKALADIFQFEYTQRIFLNKLP